jgi:RNA polymerase sigma-70 factor (ECF subfamily)
MSDTHAGFESWYAANHNHVVAVLTLVSGDPDTASEAADEAFARALAQWNRVGAMDSPTGWTYRVALYQLRRRLRRKQQERLLLEELSRGSEMSEPDLSLWLQVIDAVRPLTRRQRTVLALTYLADMPQAQVAKALHVTRSTVASTLADAKAAVAPLPNHAHTNTKE